MSETVFLDLVDRCYGALEKAGGWQALTCDLGEALGADAGDIVTEDPDTGAIRTYGSFGFDPQFLDSYDVEFLGENPWLSNLQRFAPGEVRADLEQIGGFRDSAYYNEWVKPQKLDHTLGALLPVAGGGMTWVGFARAPGTAPFGAEKGLLQRLLPHLTRGLNLARRMTLDPENMRESASGQSVMCLSDALAQQRKPALWLDRRGRVVDLNAAAEACLARGGVVLSRSGRLEAVNRQDNITLRSAVKAALEGVTQRDANRRAEAGAPVLVRCEEGRSLGVDLHPCRLQETPVGATVATSIGVLVLIHEGCGAGKRLDLSLLQQEFGLTETELALVRHLACGGQLDGFAQTRGMKLSTARWHLKNAEAKTGTSRSQQLVALAFCKGIARA